MRQATVHWAIGRANMPLLVVKICWTGALNCSLTQQQERFILGAVENKKGVSMRRLAQYSLSKNPVLYLGQPLWWALLVQDKFCTGLQNQWHPWSPPSRECLFKKKSNPSCVASLRLMEDFWAAPKRAVHNGSQLMTPMTALKQQITQRAHPVPLPVILCPLNTKIVPHPAPEMAIGPSTIRPPLATYHAVFIHSAHQMNSLLLYPSIETKK